MKRSRSPGTKEGTDRQWEQKKRPKRLRYEVLRDDWGECMDDGTGRNDHRDEPTPPSPTIVMGRGRCITTSPAKTVRSLITDYFTPRTGKMMSTTTTTVGDNETTTTRGEVVTREGEMTDNTWQGTPPSSGDDDWLLDLSQPGHVHGHHQDKGEDKSILDSTVGDEDNQGDDKVTRGWEWAGTPPSSGDDSWLLRSSQSGRQGEEMEDKDTEYEDKDSTRNGMQAPRSLVGTMTGF